MQTSHNSITINHLFSKSPSVNIWTFIMIFCAVPSTYKVSFGQNKTDYSHLSVALEIYRYQNNISNYKDFDINKESILDEIIKSFPLQNNTPEVTGSSSNSQGVDFNNLPSTTDLVVSPQTDNSLQRKPSTILKEKLKKELSEVNDFLMKLDTILKINKGKFYLDAPEITYLPLVNNYLEGQLVAAGTSVGLSSLFNISQAEIAKGIADWALKRAQEELLKSFLQDWLDKLEKDTLTGLVFPNTKNFMLTSDISTLITKGESWQSAFKADFDQLPTNTPKISKYILRKYGKKLDQKQILEIQSGVEVASIIYKGLSERKKMDEIVLLLGENADIKDTSLLSATDKAVLLTNIMFNSISDREPDEVSYYTANQIVNLNEQQLALWWSVIFSKEKKKFKKIFNLKDKSEINFYNKVLNKTMTFRTKAAEVAVNYNHLIQLTKTSGLNSKEFDVNILNEYFTTSIDMIGSSSSLVQFIHPDFEADSAAFNDVRKYLENSFSYLGGIQEGASTQNYGMVVTNAINFLMWMGDEIKSKNEDAKLEGLKATSEVINKYGKFMISVINADSSEQISKAIGDIAMKSGGYLVKQTASWSAMLNMYPGIKGGWERLSATTGQTAERFEGNFAGATLPIGIEVSKGFRKSFIGAIGGFVQVLDLGAVLNYSINDNDSISSLPEFGFEQLLSPGGYFTVHLRNNPITLGIGASMLPQLRNISDGDANFKASAFQVGAFLAVDLSIIPLWTSPKKFKYYKSSKSTNSKQEQNINN